MSGRCPLFSYLCMERRECLLVLQGADALHWLDYHNFSERGALLTVLLMLRWGILLPLSLVVEGEIEREKVEREKERERERERGLFSPDAYYYLADWRGYITLFRTLLQACTTGTAG
eukprot:CAMPEP_0119128406 /NCGR_PEP_ID=MMETSP1310-20130426/6578_1 /TAXON_ID=464262 /ORGANISM="Genus nov. species nov., Strain RCC2339" /LENGTH=116 /DNA_ID=CAMNT_0007118747 /DNA_START=290 /DNA_END=637 /DNA_ORIENTATION=-